MSRLPKQDQILSIQEAALVLGVSTKTLRRWESAGKLTPERTTGGHRRYLLSGLKQAKRDTKKVNRLRTITAEKPIQIDTFAVNSVPSVIPILPKETITFTPPFVAPVIPDLPEIIEPVVIIKSKSRLKPIAGLVFLAFGFALILSAGTNFLAPKVAEKVNLAEVKKDLKPSVLAIQTTLDNLVFRVNVPSQFNGEVEINGDLTSELTEFNIFPTNVTTLNLGGTTTTTNVLNDLTVANDLEVEGIATLPTIVTGEDTITDFTGTGLQVNNTVLEVTLGTSIGTNEIEDNSITEPKLKISNSGTSGQILSYDSTNEGFTWVAATPAGVTGTGTANSLAKFTAAGTIGNSSITDDGTTISIASADISFDDANLTSAITLTDIDTVFDSGDTAIVDAINTAFNAAASGGVWTLTGNVIHPTTITNDVAVGGTTLAASMFGIDESAGNFYFGYDNSANPTLNFEATDADAGEFGFNTNDAFYFSNANVGIGTISPGAKLDVVNTANDDAFTITANGTQSNPIMRIFESDGSTESVRFYPAVGDGASALAYTFNTTAALSNATAQLASFRNDGTPQIILQALGGAIFNEAGNDSDFRVEGDTNANLLFVDASTDRVGIGTNAPGDMLTVQNGDIRLQRSDTTGTQISSYWGGATSYGLTINSNLSSTSSYPNLYGVRLGTVFSSIPTSGSYDQVQIRDNFAPTSGTAISNMLDLVGTINQTGGANGITRGLYINPTLTAAADFRGLEISNNSGYGIYQSGASASNFFAGNTGIGDSSPSSKLEVGDGTDSLQISSVGDLTFVDADGAASITGPAGGTLTVAAGAAQDLTLTAADDIIFDDAQIGGVIQLSVVDGSFDSGDTGIIDAINTAYGAATGGGGGLWQLSGNVINPTSSTQDLAIGGTTLAASIFSIDEDTGNFYFGYDNSANPTLNFEATDGDAGEFGFNTSDSFSFMNANVAIGVSAGPAAVPLTVYGGTSGAQIEARNNVGNVSYINITDNSTGAGDANGLIVGYNTDGIIFNRENTDLLLGTNNITRIDIDSGGNVGIGVDSSPDYLLEVNTASASDPTFALSDGDIAHGVTGLVNTDILLHLAPFSSTDGGAQLTALADNVNTAQALSIRGILGNTPDDTVPAISLIGAKGSGTGIVDLAAAETVFQVANNDDAAGFTIQGNGDVGIGTVNPGSKLEIIGTGGSETVLAVKGGTSQSGDFIRLTDSGGTLEYFSVDPTVGAVFNEVGSSAVDLRVEGDTIASLLFVDASADAVGLGTTAPDARLEINHATGDNLRLTYNDADGSAANYTDFEISSSGDITITPSGSDLQIGKDGLDGNLTLYNELGATDYFVKFQTSASQAESTTYTLPINDGTDNYVLTTDGSGVLAWEAVGGGGGLGGDITAVGNITSGDAFTSGTPGGSLYFATGGDILDANGNELIQLTTTASAVNELTLANAAAGGNVTWTLTGGDTDIGLTTILKAAGSALFSSTTANTDTIAIKPQTSTATNSFTGTITSADLTATRTWTIPDATGDFCLSSGNCAGGAGGSKWTDGGTVTYLTDTAEDLAVGGTTVLGSMFGLDESAGNFYFGYDNSANATLNFEATDGDAGEFGFNTNDAFFFSNANVGIGTTAPGAKLDSLSTTEQLRLSYDASNYTSFTTGSSGILNIDSTDSNNTVTFGVGALNILGNATPQINATNASIVVQNVTLNAISSTTHAVSIQPSITPASGTGIFSGLAIQPTVNQTGGANGITRGLYINPTLTAAVDFRGLEISNNSGYGLYQSGASASNYLAGNTGIGDSSPSSKLEVGDGTDSLRVSSVGDLTFVDADGGASITGPAGGALAIDSSLTGLNLQADGTIDVNLAGGSGATGCTVANTTGNLTCTGTVSGSNGTFASTLQNAYDNDGDGSDTLITLSTSDDSLIFRNPTATAGTDSAFTLQIDNIDTGLTTANFKNLNVTEAGSFDTTAGVLTNYGGFFNNTSTRSAGANALTNIGLYANASGAQNNYAAFFENGNVGIGALSSSYKLNVTGNAFITTGARMNNVQAGINGDSTIEGNAGGGGKINLQNATTEAFTFTSYDNTTNANVFVFNAQPNGAEDLFEIQKDTVAQFNINSTGNINLLGGVAHSIANSSGLTLTAAATGLNLQPDGTIDVNVAGGSGATGCTVTNTTGDLTCTGNIVGSGSGTAGFWSRTGTNLSPATAGDDVLLPDGDTITFGTGSDASITYDGTNLVIDPDLVGTGTVRIAGTEGADKLTLTAGDAVISDGSLLITDDDDAVSLGVTNNTATTIGAGINTAGVIDFSSTSLTTGNLLNLETTAALTSGRVLNVTSTSTALTSGMLGRFDWAPGSATTATGDLFNINIGTNGTTTGNLFSISDTGSVLFSVSETAMTSNVPASFNAAGDVSMAYDLQFTNQTASYIKSKAPLYIEAGESFESNDLTFKTYNSGDIVFDDDTLTTPIVLSDVDTSLPNSNIGIVDAINDAYNAATGGGGGLWQLSTNVINPTSATQDFAIGGTTLAASIFGIDESAGDFYFGYDNSANPSFNFEATDADSGTFGFNTSDTFHFSNANVGIGTTLAAQELVVNAASGDSEISIKAVDASASILYFGDTGSNTVAALFRPGGTENLTIWFDGGVGGTVNFNENGNTAFGADSTPDYLVELHDATNTPAFALSDDDIAHGVTTLAETDVFYHLTSLSTTDGGAQLTALADNVNTAQALSIRGILGNTPDDTVPAIKLVGAKGSGTGIVDLAAAETVFQVANNDDAAALTVLGNGFVGIGDTTPGALLEINSATDAYIKIDNSNGGGSNISGLTIGNAGAVDWTIRKAAGTGDSLEFYNASSSVVGTWLYSGELGIGMVASSRFEVGDGTDSLEVSSVGDLTFVDANGAASITGPAGGTLTVASGAAQDLTLTGADDIIFDDAQIGGVIQLSSVDGSFDSGDTGIIDAINTAYGAATGGGGGLWQLSANVINPTSATQDFAIGGTTLAASIFGIDESAGDFFFGYDNSANPTLNFEATDADAGELGFNTNDAFYFSNANVGIGDISPDATFDIDSNSLTTGKAVSWDITNTAITDAAINPINITLTNGQTTTANTISYTGLNLGYFHNPSVATTNETVGRISIMQNNNSPTDTTIGSILRLDNLDTATGNSLTVPNALLITASTASGIGTAINVNDANIDTAVDIGSNPITGTAYSITNSGAGNDITIASIDDLIFDDAQVTNIQLSDADATLPNSNIGIVDAINDAYTAATGTQFTLDGDDADTEAIALGNTLLVAGGANGIDTDVSATDTITLNLDTTEIGTATFGSGSDFTWTFNSSGGDSALAFTPSAAKLTSDAITLQSLTGSANVIFQNDTARYVTKITNVGITFEDTASTVGATIQTLSGESLTLHAHAVGLNLQNDGAIDVNLAGGSGATGCTVANTTGNFTCTGTITGSGGALASTLQNAYDNDANGSDTLITLSANDDSLVLTNPTSAGTDSDFVVHINQANTTDTLSALDITQASNAFDAVNITANTIDTENVIDVVANGLTTGTGLSIASSGVIASGGELISLAGTGITTGRLLDITSAANTLTTGQLVNISSTATSITTGAAIANGGTNLGSLLNVSLTGNSTFSGNIGTLDWSPTSATTATGNLFTLNLGTNATLTGDIFQIQDAGSDLFGVNESQITSSLPHQFTAAGDAAFAYDIVLTNQTASFIKSYGPLTIEGGESFENNDLTLKTYGTGNIIIDPASTGYAQLEGATRFNTQLTLANDATPDVSGGTWFTTGGTTTITDFDAGAGALEDGHIIIIEGAHAVTIDCSASAEMDCGAADIAFDNDDIISLIYDATEDLWRVMSWVDETDTQTGADVAEMYVGTTDMQPGDVVSIDATQNIRIQKSVATDGSRVIGIVSTQPGLILDDGYAGELQTHPVALVGRVPVRVSPNSAAIQPGDLIGASTDIGKAEKINSGFIIGRALEAWTPGSGQEVIKVFVNPIYVNETQLAQTDYENRIIDLENAVLLLQSQGELGEGSGIPDTFTDLTVNNLTVLEDTLLSDTVVNGKLSVGSLMFDNINNSVNAVGTLRIQDMGLGSIEFLGGLITFDTNGNAVVQTITADKYKVAGASAGTGTLVADESEVFIDTDQVTEDSLIFVTPKTLVDYPLVVTQKQEGVGFKIQMSVVSSTDTEFDWWIVDKTE